VVVCRSVGIWTRGQTTAKGLRIPLQVSETLATVTGSRRLTGELCSQQRTRLKATTDRAFLVFTGIPPPARATEARLTLRLVADLLVDRSVVPSLPRWALLINVEILVIAVADYTAWCHMNDSAKVRSPHANKDGRRTKRRQPSTAGIPSKRSAANAAPALSLSPGLMAQTIKGLVDRIGEIAGALGSYEALLAVLVLSGVVALLLATDLKLWLIFSLIVIGMVLPLVAKVIRTRN
jgi:hypothetical protein